MYQKSLPEEKSVRIFPDSVAIKLLHTYVIWMGRLATFRLGSWDGA